MVTDRKFAAFSPKAVPPRMKEIPEGGMCISSFVVLSKSGEAHAILMGRINKNAPWDHVGALDPGRVARMSDGWMLPSSHLILYETAEGAARRILREQLKINEMRLQPPLTFFDTSGTENHWDIGFIYQGERDSVPTNPEIWAELKFVDVRDLKDSEVVRSQLDVLRYCSKNQP